MLYWLFTEGRLWSAALIVPSGLLTILLTLILASRTKQSHSRLRVLTYLAFSLALAAGFILLLSHSAIQRGRNTLPPILDWLVGCPATVDGSRILSFGGLLVLVLLAGNLLLTQQMRPASVLQEWLNLLKRPYKKRGKVGSSHFCTPGEFRRFRNQDIDGIILEGAFWGERNRRLDSGIEQLYLSSEDATRGILALGSPGSGKSQAVILPIIAQKMQAGMSLIVADPQGELKSHILKLAGQLVDKWKIIA